jgi:hypothetical protein
MARHRLIPCAPTTDPRRGSDPTPRRPPQRPIDAGCRNRVAATLRWRGGIPIEQDMNDRPPLPPGTFIAGDAKGSRRDRQPDRRAQPGATSRTPGRCYPRNVRTPCRTADSHCQPAPGFAVQRAPHAPFYGRAMVPDQRSGRLASGGQHSMHQNSPRRRAPATAQVAAAPHAPIRAAAPTPDDTGTRTLYLLPRQPRSPRRDPEF